MPSKKLYILLLSILVLCQSRYQIPSYYGFWSKRFYQPKVVLAGQFTVFEMHFAIDINYEGTVVYFADEAQHCVMAFDLNSLDYRVIAGRCSKAGDRVGSAHSVLFNRPSAIAYFMPDPQRSANASNAKVHLTVNEKCSIQDPDCLLDDVKLQTLQNFLSLQNIRLRPPVNLFSTVTQRQQYIFIADKMNHCIKRITLHTQHTEVVAGFCGEAGFLDGPLGFNRLNQPSNIGVDAQGFVYFFDEGNEYMRKLDLQHNVETLLNGACTQYKRQNEKNREVNGFELRKMICYSNWIQKKTGSPTQHYFNDELLNICPLHSSKCPP